MKPNICVKLIKIKLQICTSKSYTLAPTSPLLSFFGFVFSLLFLIYKSSAYKPICCSLILLINVKIRFMIKRYHMIEWNSFLKLVEILPEKRLRTYSSMVQASCTGDFQYIGALTVDHEKLSYIFKNSVV